MFGPLFEFLIADHARLSELLERANSAGEVDLSASQSLRSGLFMQVSMEEIILLPALERAHGVTPATVARLRRSYRALSTLLAAAPSAGIVHTLGAVFADHDRLERVPGGLYEACE